MDDDRRRLLIFGLSIVVGLASGSNYVYSAYAPQLSTDLHISSTTVNLIGLAGNLGVYSSGPLWGKMNDSRGQRIPLLLGGLFLLIGYSTIRLYLLHPFLLRSDTSSRLPPSTLRLVPLLAAMFLTGAAGSAGLASSVNATARSFPSTTRASATGAVLAGFGLSAFFFSSLGHVLFGGDASGLLGLLAIGTGVPMLLGAVWIRAIPPTEDKGGYERLRNAPEIVFDGEVEPEGVHRVKATASSRSPSPSLELIRSRSPHIANTRRPASTKSSFIQTEYTPLELLRTPSFLLLGLILAILCGTGLMYINNVGTIALVLARGGKVSYDKREVSGWQAVNVGWISVWNCLGRIGGGVISDIWSSRYQGQRIWLLPIVAALFILAQLSALYISHVEHLWLVSSLLGGAYGCLFNVMPMLVLEWYGIAHFSQNFGWICVAPVIGGNLFNLIFGTVYDSNSIGLQGTRPLDRAMSSNADDGAHACLLGIPCYSSAFKATLFGCFIAQGISIGLGLDRSRLEKGSREKQSSGLTPAEEEAAPWYDQS